MLRSQKTSAPLIVNPGSAGQFSSPEISALRIVSTSGSSGIVLVPLLSEYAHDQDIHVTTIFIHSLSFSAFMNESRLFVSADCAMVGFINIKHQSVQIERLKTSILKAISLPLCRNPDSKTFFLQ